MGVAQWRIWQIGIFKNIAFLTSAQTTTMDVFLVKEEGTLGLEKLSLSTGFVKSIKRKVAWHALHNLTIRMSRRDLPVLPISERSRIPLDPYNNSRDDENVGAINDIADTRYTEAFSKLKDHKAETDNAKMARTVLYIVAIIAIIAFIVPNFNCGAG